MGMMFQFLHVNRHLNLVAHYFGRFVGYFPDATLLTILVGFSASSESLIQNNTANFGQGWACWTPELKFIKKQNCPQRKPIILSNAKCVIY